MARYVRANRIGIKIFDAEITVMGGNGDVDIMAHFDHTGFALQFTADEAVHLAMLLMKHAGAGGREQVA